MTGTEPRTLMGWIISSSLRFRHLVIAAGVALMVLGVVVVPRMHVDAFPEFAPPRVVIQTACLGLSTSDVEQLVTIPLEAALNGVQGLDDMRSKSVPQLSSIEVLFKPGTDLLRARQLVQERLAAVSPSLPTWAAPPVMLAPTSATGRAMQIGMTSKSHSLIQMSMTAYWVIRARLLRVPGVANVAIWNERLDLMAVQAKPSRMLARKVALNQVMRATSDAVDSGLLKFSAGSVIGTGGTIETPNQRISVRNVLPVVTPADLAKVPVTKKDGKTIRLGDVAAIGRQHQPLIGDAVIDGRPGLLLVVEKLPWANSLQMTNGVERALRELQPGLPGIKFDTKVFQQTDFVKLAIHNLTQALVLGFILVVIILALFLLEWRAALISLVTIPLALVTAMLVLYAMGSTINTMTLAGLVIALGAVVDDAIIDVENIARRLRSERLSRSGHPTATVILRACLEVRSPIVYATLIIVAASIPVFLLSGLTGAFFRPLALSYTLAIVASMLVALTMTPALALLLLRGSHIERRASPLVTWLQRGYTTGLHHVIIRPIAAFAVFAAVTVAGIAVYPHLGQSLFPGFRERDFLVHWVAPPGTSSAEMERSTTKISRELLAIPGVQSAGAHIGQAFLGEEVAGVNLGEIWVSLSPTADYNAAVARIQSVTNGYPGMFREVQTYLDERIQEVLTGAKEPIIVRTYGDNLTNLRAKSDQILRLVQSVRGVTGAHRDISSDVPQVSVKVRLAAAERYGLKPGDVRRDAATLVAGEEVGDIFRAGKAYDTVVWSPPSTRHSFTDIANLPIDTPSGKVIRLKSVADVSLQPNPNSIERQGASRYLDVGAEVSGRDLGAVVSDIRKKLGTVHLDRGFHVELLGEYRERQAAQSRLLESSVIAGIAILLLLQASFRRWRLAFLTFLTLPMALVGGVLAAWLGGGIISLGALVGFFTVFGIAARNGILLINHWQQLEVHEGMEFGPALVLRGARERLSPILMTSLATGLALVPLVVLGDRPGHEIEHPLAVVVLGGLFTSTLLNLFIVPSLYLRFGRGKRERSRSPRMELPMRARQRIWPVTMIAALSAAWLAACAGSGSGSPPDARRTAQFPHPTQVDNRLFPLVPGTQFSYHGTIVEGGRAAPHSVVFTVTDLTKTVDGVRTVVAWDRDFLRGRLQEQELAFFAQDSLDNVWNFGEYPEKYENGRFAGAPSTWIKGTGGGYGGIHVLGRPATGDRWVEGRVPAIDFYDISRVLSTGQTTCTRLRCFRTVVVDEWSPGDPKGGHQIKYYAQGAGLVRIGARGGDSQEFLKLTAVRHLGARAIARVRAEVTAMDRRAYRISRVYRTTGPVDCCSDERGSR